MLSKDSIDRSTKTIPSNPIQRHTFDRIPISPQDPSLSVPTVSSILSVCFCILPSRDVSSRTDSLWNYAHMDSRNESSVPAAIPSQWKNDIPSFRNWSSQVVNYTTSIRSQQRFPNQKEGGNNWVRSESLIKTWTKILLHASCSL